MGSETTKKCTTCGETKPLSEFYKKHTSRDGHRTKCKPCCQAWLKEYNKRPEVAATRQKKNREHWLENREERKAACREYYATNREELLEWSKRYNQENPHISWARHYRDRAIEYGYPLIEESLTREDVVSEYGDKCWHCETGDFEELDHYPLAVALGGAHVLSNVRPSCHSCNIAQIPGIKAKRARQRAS